MDVTFPSGDAPGGRLGARAVTRRDSAYGLALLRISSLPGPRVPCVSEVTVGGRTRDRSTSVRCLISRLGREAVVELPNVEPSLEVLASNRRAVLAEAYDEIRLGRGEFISDRDPEIYGQEIWFEATLPAGGRVAIIQSEILVTFPEFKPRVLSFLLTAPKPVFEDCALDFRKLFDSILVKESE